MMSTSNGTGSPVLSDDLAMAEVVTEITDRLNAGDEVDVADYAARCPGREEQLKELVEALRVVGRTGASMPTIFVDEPAPKALGDFRIIREVGRGGMGIVYEAEQLSLGRRVALKVLPYAATMDPKQLQRFHNEARAAASLHHEHIVPVFGIGCERAVHFYAMQFIEGVTLAAVIGDMRNKDDSATATRISPALKQEPKAANDEPTRSYVPSAPANDTATIAAFTESTLVGPRDQSFFRRAAELGIQAAEALEHAHSMGVVHRDIKPGNLMLDARGKVWITDFGLARFGVDSDLTMSGDLVGTLRYMSPEQALARHGLVDHRADVYSLGAVLYELLTGRYVVRGADKQEILRQIAFEEPASPRKLSPAIPTDLETIVMKAIEKNPEERYGSAKELAEDLRRFTEFQPVLAKRPTIVQRATRWSRRHRPVVWSTAVSLFLVMAAVAGSVGWVVRDRSDRFSKTAIVVLDLLQDSERLQKDSKYHDAWAVAKRAEGFLAQGGGSKDLREKVRERVADLEMVLRLEEVRLTGTAVKKNNTFDEKQIYTNTMLAFREFGIDVEVLEAAEAVNRLRDRSIRLEMAAALDECSVVAGDGRTALRLLELARAIDPDEWRNSFRDLVEKDDLKGLIELGASAKTSDQPARNLVTLGRLLYMHQAYEPAVKMLRKAQLRFPGDFWVNETLAGYLHFMGPTHADESLRYFTAALALHPENPGAMLNVGILLCDKGQFEDAVTAYREAIRLKPDYATAYGALGVVADRKGQLDAAIELYREAIRLNPDNHIVHFNIGVVFEKKGQFDAAVAASREAIRLKPDFFKAFQLLGEALAMKGDYEGAISAYRETIRLKPDRVHAHGNLIAMLGAKGQLDAAISAYREAIRLKADDESVHFNLGEVLLENERLDDAISAFKEAIRLKPDFAKAHTSLGDALSLNGQSKAAALAFREAVRLEPNSVDLHNRLGFTLVNSGQIGDAIVAYREAIRLNPELASAQCGLAAALLQNGQATEAIPVARRAQELAANLPELRESVANLIQRCDEAIKLDGKLRAVLRGEAKPATNSEVIGFARICVIKKQNLAAAQFFKDAFSAPPELAENLIEEDRYNAACAAALAGCGIGAESLSLDETQRVQWRRQALNWLRADLALRTKRPDDAKEQRDPELREALRRWQNDTDLVGVRDDAALMRLSDAEQKEWRQFWTDVATTIATAKGKKQSSNTKKIEIIGR
jgi:serine/threonine protein kinase/tetratricopeptide (TPR) repeat protein